MKSFNYTIRNVLGILGRPARQLSRKVAQYDSTVMVKKDGRAADPLRVMNLINLGVRCGDTITVTVNGSDEETAAPALEIYFQQHL